MDANCPVDLAKPWPLYERLKSYLNGLGQEDGYWSQAGKVAIPIAYPDSLLARKLQENLEPGYIARTTKYVADHFENYAEDMVFMMKTMGFEFANGWRVFPIKTIEDECLTEWFVSGMLFPSYDGKIEGWVVWAHISEVFG
jgi:hypothetical protein